MSFDKFVDLSVTITRLKIHDYFSNKNARYNWDTFYSCNYCLNYLIHCNYCKNNDLFEPLFEKTNEN